jgi:hypothetical protein
MRLTAEIASRSLALSVSSCERRRKVFPKIETHTRHARRHGDAKKIATFSLQRPSYATLPGYLLYPLVRTGPVVPAHPGDDQERVQAEREALEDALCPAWPGAMLLRARRS